jgi:predicted molibdopterin-dependent oxidoreductase YjgC
MFVRLPDPDATAIAITVDGEPVSARSGDTVAAALLAAGHLAGRTTPVSGAPRGPYCMMGVCFDCLVTIDGRPNEQGCMIVVAPGMHIATQHGARSVDASLDATGDAPS